MISSFLIGLAAGARSMTPLAVVSDAASRGTLRADSAAPPWLGSPLVAAGTKALAAAELGGDKMRSAPDRIVAAGLAARILTAGLAGAALAPRGRGLAGAALGAAAAVGAAYLTFGLRKAAMRRFGQTSTGLIEDALTVGMAQLVMAASSHPAQDDRNARRVRADGWRPRGGLTFGARRTTRSGLDHPGRFGALG